MFLSQNKSYGVVFGNVIIFTRFISTFTAFVLYCRLKFPMAYDGGIEAPNRVMFGKSRERGKKKFINRHA